MKILLKLISSNTTNSKLLHKFVNFVILYVNSIVCFLASRELATVANFKTNEDLFGIFYDVGVPFYTK